MGQIGRDRGPGGGPQGPGIKADPGFRSDKFTKRCAVIDALRRNILFDGAYKGKEKTVICLKCNYEAPKSGFRYLYNPRIDASIALRQCPRCMMFIAVDELYGYVKQNVGPGDEIWGKSAGIERFLDQHHRQGTTGE